jgi:hypothetical protein
MTHPYAAPTLENTPMALFRFAALAAFLVAASVPVAFGQPTGYPDAPPPVYVPQPPSQMRTNAGVSLPPAGTAAPGAGAYPPPAYGAYGYPGYQGAVGGALSGAANVIGAQGQYNIQTQESRMLQTQADMSRLKYRNALIQQQRYEQAMQPTVLEMRERQQWQNLQSARNNPPNPQIWSGDALNAIFKAIQGADRQGLRAGPVPVDPEVLKAINLTTGQTSGAGAGMLKNITNLNWPFALQDAPYKDSSAKINALAIKAVDEVKADGRVTAQTFGQLSAAVNTLDNAVRVDQVLSPTDYIVSKGFVDDLKSSIQSFRNPNVASYLNGGIAAKGPTVADLVEQMTSQGLTFAPATQEDQPAYTILYQAMATYDYRLGQTSSR